jgi:Ca2+-transporting ATPase
MESDRDRPLRWPCGMSEKKAWHALDLAAVFEAIASTESGLAAVEAEARLRRDGPNVLPRKPPPTFAEVFLHQFQSPLIYILLVAGVVSLGLREWTDAGFIFGVVLLNAVIGTWQEWKAERGMLALQKFLDIRAVAVRDGEAVEIPAESLVAGDVVLLESGNRVPADVRLLSTSGLEVDESLLTGESTSVWKDAAWTGPEAAPLGDRHNLGFAGSTVVRGRARAAVVATGTSTVIGNLAKEMLEAAGGKPPLVVRMERFTRMIALVVLAASVVVGLIGIFLRGFGIGEMFLFAVALAVSAIPEGLPVAMTVALSVATARMARRAVIVRRLAAVEGLGSCTMIASDKTGTLTQNELTVREARAPDGTRFEATGLGFAPEGEVRPAGDRPAFEALARAAVLCNEGELSRKGDKWVWRGDPTDVALLSFGLKAGIERRALLERHPQMDQIPFEPERRYAATFHRGPEGRVSVLVKGAPERVLDMCRDATEAARATAEELAAAGLRVLAFAEGEGAPGSDPANLSYLGLIGMIDPLRPGVRDAIAECRRAGIAVTMITGDHPVTALAIARDLGLAERPEEVLSGVRLERLSSEGIADAVRRTKVFARVAPDQKLTIVEAAQQAGHFVAVTGDGVNDAPALKQANIGVAMGRSGTDVAREAAELVITDDNFVSIVAGVEEGRVAYDNIRKVIYLLVSTGAAEILLAGLAIALGTPIPLLPVQILWLNLVTNGVQDVALAFEPGETDVMGRRPRPPKEPIFNRLMIERTLVGAAVMGIVGFGAFQWMLLQGWSVGEARNALLLLMVLFENVHVGNCRSETRSALVMSPFQSPILLGGVVLAFGIHLASMHLPFMRALLGTEPVSSEVWLAVVPLALTVLVAIELHKLAWSLRYGTRWLGGQK